MSRSCDSNYGCEMDAPFAVDGWDYCAKHYKSYLLAKERYVTDSR